MIAKRCSLTFIIILLLGITASGQDSTTVGIKQEPKGKVYAQAFGDYFFKVHADSAGRGSSQYSKVAQNYHAGEIRRFYFGYDYEFNDKFSARMLLSHENSYDVNGNRSVFVKLANVKWKNIYPMGDLVIGQMATNTWSLSEKIWKYRSLEKTVTDMRGLGKSNDMGVMIQGKINEEWDWGYNVMLGNGAGPKPEFNTFKKYYADVYFKFSEKKLLLDFYVDYERIKTYPYKQSKFTYKALVAYVTEPWALGIEVVRQIKSESAVHNEFGSAVKDTTKAVPLGVSVFFRGQLIEDRLGFVTRFDLFSPDTKYNSDLEYDPPYATSNEFFYLLALDITPNKQVHIMPNIWYNKFSNKDLNAAGSLLKDYDFCYRITVHFELK